jgi:hypothetical protein
MERYEEAVRDYEQAKKLDPENAGAASFFWRGLAWLVEIINQSSSVY